MASIRKPGGTRLLALVAVISLIAGLGLFLVKGRTDARTALIERFRDRGDIGARFVEAYVKELTVREITLAERRLRSKRVKSDSFAALAESLQLQAAVLLDERGRAIATVPHSEELIGTNLARKYEHLAAALDGQIAISNVVPSAVEQAPIVAVAVPFSSQHGRRVFSGAVALSATALGRTYLANITPVAGARAYLIDEVGATIASSEEAQPDIDAFREQLPEVARWVATVDDGSASVGMVEMRFHSSRVEETPWRLVTTVPEDQLFAPLSGVAGLAPWVVFLALMVAATIGLVQLNRITASRASLAKVNSELEKSNQEIELYARSQRLFIASASHELRTPLTSILGYLEIVEESDLTPQQRDAVGVVTRNAHRLLGLVNSLLGLLRMEQRGLRSERVDMAEVTAEAIQSVRPAAERKQIDVRVSSEPSPVMGDREQLAQALDNLLSNAVKFTPERGNVDVTVASCDGSVVCTVADTGMGIPEDERHQLFMTFFRTSTAVASEISGSGLGLSITRSIVEAHQGAIKVEHRDPGTAFSIELPRAPD